LAIWSLSFQSHNFPTNWPTIWLNKGYIRKKKKKDEKKYIVNNTATISCEWVIRASSILKYPLLLNFYTKKREGKPRKEKPFTNAFTYGWSSAFHMVVEKSHSPINLQKDTVHRHLTVSWKIFTGYATITDGYILSVYLKW
jgi:hypothetical protein